ncbi:tRNA (adenine(22)-N(1))-methyltransferase [Planococcus massiliensis]|uniref:tRNA (Adenine(22)-N(1))-methyltransferase n=1 Tax=Planococcus massiliensis TaxID=1499687 RepID=A0A098EMF5_9BACL|nr:tRNA (adenine(22)-N(1))-methyltransferase TrmK [Planococcus massiliensis]CEG22985.1 tRNA (adenine(22)-N(1))-methyltransferase [Planococcus massiliensis]
MNAQQLSLRLERVAKHVPKGAIVADIGSDHAYLPCFLVLNGMVKRAVAGEVVKGPFESAKKQVQQEQLENQITVRLASGLAAIHPEDGVTAVTIAGMGGPLIVSILTEGIARLEGVERLILQPNVHAKAIRDWAQQNGWNVHSEEILKENDKIYEILVLERAEANSVLTETELLMGPYLMKERSPVFIEKWRRESAQWKKIVASMEATEQTVEILSRKNDLVHKIQLVEEVLNNENTEWAADHRGV